MLEIYNHLTLIYFHSYRIVQVREHALAKHFDYDSYDAISSSQSVKIFDDHTSCLTIENRDKLMRHIFETSAKVYWSEFETRVRREVESLERFFNKSTTRANQQQHHQLRNIYVHEWSPFFVGEPILVKNLLDSVQGNYNLTSNDLILAARESYSELTIHFLIDSVSSFSQNAELLSSDEDDGGNFLEHLFCRMCRERQRDSRFALRRVFLEALIMRNAKMTCSRALLELFLSDDQVHQFRLSSTYFPMLFLLSKCFRLFLTEQDQRRFEQLTAWMHSRTFTSPPSQKANTITTTPTTSTPALSTDQIDLIFLEYFSHRTSHFKQVKTVFSFDLSLKDLARREFMKLVSLPSPKPPSKSNEFLLNKVNDSLRTFLFYVLDLNNIFN